MISRRIARRTSKVSDDEFGFSMAKSCIGLSAATEAQANQFLSFEKCVQRMQCPLSRKERCAEECRAGSFDLYLSVQSVSFLLGNTEEEIEEHIELVRNEDRTAFTQPPKSKYELSDEDEGKRPAKNEL